MSNQSTETVSDYALFATKVIYLGNRIWEVGNTLKCSVFPYDYHSFHKMNATY